MYVIRLTRYAIRPPLQWVVVGAYTRDCQGRAVPVRNSRLNHSKESKNV